MSAVAIFNVRSTSTPARSRHVAFAHIAAIAEGRAEWVKPTLERQFAVAVVRPQGAQKLPLPATLPLFKPQLSTPFYVTGSILKVWASSAARWQTGWLSPRHKLNSTVTS
jgi:hypothetical protein